MVRQETQERQAKAELHAEIAKVVERAQEQAEKTRDGSSKRARVQAIRTNRKIERDTDRGAQGWRLGQEDVKPDRPEEQTDEDAYVPPPNRIALLRKLRDQEEEPK